MKKVEKINKIKQAFRDKVENEFHIECIEELENESFESWEDFIGEWIWEDYKIDIEIDSDLKNELEEIFYDLKDDYLTGKWESREI